MTGEPIETLPIEQSREIRARQQARARVLGLVLGALCILFFAITIVKIGVWG